MTSLSPVNIVIDASIAIDALLPTLAPVDTLELFQAWRQSSTEIVAPSRWLAESTSVIRRYVYAGLLTLDEGVTTLDHLTVIASIHFNRGKVYVRNILTHADNDKGTWQQ